VGSVVLAARPTWGKSEWAEPKRNRAIFHLFKKFQKDLI
jgi:hypothetical protein